MTVKYIYLLSALFGLLLPMAVRALNVCNTGAYPHYASPYAFHKNTATDIGYAYNSNGSMTRNPDRHIGLIEYDCFNNPRLIQFTDGSATEYVYDASGTKLKTVHRTAVPGIEVPYGTVYEHTSSTVLSSDSTLYAGPFVLSGGSLRYKYDGGSVLIPLDGSPVKPCFYALDHLGSVRLVVSADGQVIERNDYYPSGCLITDNIDGETVILPYKYNGKELDPMHGLYTYDYGARQYDPATMLWDRMDPLCEDNPEVSPYVFCHNNSVNRIDIDGKADYFTPQGRFLKSDNNDKDPYIYIIEQKKERILLSDYNFKYELKPMMRIFFHYAFKLGIINSKLIIGARFAKPNEKQKLAISKNNIIRVISHNGYFKKDLNQIYNMESTVFHEYLHTQDKRDNSTEEVEVIMKEMERTDFTKTTSSFRNGTCGYLQKTLELLYHDSRRSFNRLIPDAAELLKENGAKDSYSFSGNGNEIYF